MAECCILNYRVNLQVLKPDEETHTAGNL